MQVLLEPRGVVQEICLAAFVGLLRRDPMRAPLTYVLIHLRRLLISDSLLLLTPCLSNDSVLASHLGVVIRVYQVIIEAHR